MPPTATALEIEYESRGFKPKGRVGNGFGTLKTSWDDILWEAITVGRPNRHYVFKHGLASVFEAIFRWSLVGMALEQRTPKSRLLRRTDAAKTLDPTEKGSVNYSLGMAIAKVFAESLLQAPWMLHLDVFRPQLNPVLEGGSRPDLVGQTQSGKWIVVESKVRVSKPGAGTINKAKRQAGRVKTISGKKPAYNIGAITYFAGDSHRFFWCDPEPLHGGKKASNVVVHERHWRYY